MMKLDCSCTIRESIPGDCTLEYLDSVEATNRLLVNRRVRIDYDS